MASRPHVAGAERRVGRKLSRPLERLLEEFGDMMMLTGKPLFSALRPPYPYGGEFVSQFLFTLRLVWFPLLLTTVAISYGAPGLQAANFLTVFGALDRLGGFFLLACTRPTAPPIPPTLTPPPPRPPLTATLHTPRDP